MKPLLLLLACFLGFLLNASAHPMDQYRMEMNLFPQRVEIKVMATLTRKDQPPGPQGDGLDKIGSTQVPGIPPFGALADGQDVEWTETPPRERSDAYGTWLEYDASCTFEKTPSTLDLSLNSGDLASFVVVTHYPDGTAETRLLSAQHPLRIPFQNKPPTSSQPPAATSSSSLFGAYVEHGIWHILTGYDHMLFMAALVLAATSLWDLVKVVTAFTLAHTVTLTLAVLDIIRLNERIVEPMIAASIVFVALQNIFHPRGSRGWTRLAVAFGFGLFHGLGFAGGLLEAMSGLSGVTVVTAIAAFSIGMELGHQVVVVPLYTARGLVRRASGPRAESVSRTVTVWGSALISIAGTWYLFMALFP